LSPDLVVRPLPLPTVDEALLAPMIAASEAEGYRFVRRFSTEPVDLALGAYDGDVLVGIVGLSRDPYVVDEAVGLYAVLTLRTDDARADAFYRAIGFFTAHRFDAATHWRPLADTPLHSKCRRA